MRVMAEEGENLLEDLEGLQREIADYSVGGTDEKEIPPALERYLQYVARSGNIVFPWNHVRTLFRSKILQAMEKFPGEICESSEAFVMERFDMFRAAPFTIQRLTELITYPTRHYKKKEKFLRGLEKTVLVVSTVEPWPLDGNGELRNGNDDSGSDAEMDQAFSEEEIIGGNSVSYENSEQQQHNVSMIAEGVMELKEEPIEALTPCIIPSINLEAVDAGPIMETLDTNFTDVNLKVELPEMPEFPTQNLGVAASETLQQTHELLVSTEIKPEKEDTLADAQEQPQAPIAENERLCETFCIEEAAAATVSILYNDDSNVDTEIAEQQEETSKPVISVPCEPEGTETVASIEPPQPQL